jgi:hypothetical protein
MSGPWNCVPGPHCAAALVTSDVKNSSAHRDRPPTETTSPASVDSGPSTASCTRSDPWFTPTSPLVMRRPRARMPSLPKST